MGTPYRRGIAILASIAASCAACSADRRAPSIATSAPPTAATPSSSTPHPAPPPASASVVVDFGVIDMSKATAPIAGDVTFGGEARLFFAARDAAWLFAQKDGDPDGKVRLWRSDDGGAHWIDRSPAAFDVPPRLVTIDASTAVTFAPGALLRTNDAGKTWKNVAPKKIDFADAQWIDPKNGCAVAFADDKHALLFATHDAGVTWTTKLAPLDLGGPLGADVQMLDADHAFVTIDEQGGMGSSPATLYATVDGGKTWQHRDGEGTSYFQDASTGWRSHKTGSSSHVLDVTHDGGKTWSAAKLPPFTADVVVGLVEPGFPSVDVATGLGVWPAQVSIAFTKDGGKSWSMSKLPAARDPNQSPEVVWATKPATAIVCAMDTSSRAPGTLGVLHRSIDGGATWTHVAAKFAGDRATVSALLLPLKDADFLVAVTRADDEPLRLLVSRDGGATWRSIGAP